MQHGGQRRRGASSVFRIQFPPPAARREPQPLKRGHPGAKTGQEKFDRKEKTPQEGDQTKSLSNAETQEPSMAKKSSIEKNNRRKRMTKQAAPRRAKLKAIIADRKKPMEERFAATLKLAELPRNSSATRIRNRCEMTGRPRSVYRKNKRSRIALRELGSQGLVPGLVKSSW